MSLETLTAAVSLVTSIAITAIAYGVIREKVSQLEERVSSAILESKADRKDIRDEQKGFVTYNHLDAVIEPIRNTLDTVQLDVKEILRMVSKS